MIYHLFGVTPDEAQASLAHNGTSKRCGKCAKAPVVALIFKEPSNAWGVGIGLAAACADHRHGIDEAVGEFEIDEITVVNAHGLFPAADA